MTAPLLQIGPGGDFDLTVRGRGRRLVASRADAEQQERASSEGSSRQTRPATSRAEPEQSTGSAAKSTGGARSDFFTAASRAVRFATYDATGQLSSAAPAGPSAAQASDTSRSLNPPRRGGGVPSVTLSHLNQAASTWLADQQASLQRLQASAGPVAPEAVTGLAA